MDPLYLVRLAGIEPTTPWFVAKYSIQLSYSREKQNYSSKFSRLGSPFFHFFARRENLQASPFLNRRYFPWMAAPGQLTMLRG